MLAWLRLWVGIASVSLLLTSVGRAQFDPNKAPPLNSGGQRSKGSSFAAPPGHFLPRDTPYATNRLIIKPKVSARRDQLQALHAFHGARLKKTFSRLKNIEVLELQPGQNAKQLLEEYRKSGLVEYAELDYRINVLSTTPNDPLFTNQWGLHNTGQDSGIPGVDMHAPEAWDILHDASNVVVAITDSGINLSHEDLVNQLWTNPGEIAGNGVDDDGDGYVDDVHGINAINETGNPEDDFGHGTHVAGIIGAQGNNSVGISGVAWTVKLMPLKWIDSSGGGNLSDALECLDYASAHGANIINASWGSHTYSQALFDAIDALRGDGIIFVAAAGNDGSDTDYEFVYPSCFWLDNIVSVGAMTSSNTLAFFSAYGSSSVELAAPGLDILSTYIPNSDSYSNLSGTSMAAPQVTGALALLKASRPGESYLALINRLLSGVDRSVAYQDTTISGGSLDLYNSLLTTIQTAPSNDNFSNRVAISGPSLNVYGNNLGATKETGEPNHAGNAGGHSIWWEWDPPYSGKFEITTSKSVLSNGVPMDTLLAVYTGTAVSGLSLVANNNDSNISQDGTATSTLILDAVANTKYEIAVDGTNGAQGFIKLAIQAVPRNDAFTNSFRINGRLIAVAADNIGASKETSEPNHAGNAGGRSVWFSWVAPTDGEVVLSTAGSDFDTMLAVYTGSSYPLTLVASNNDFTDVDLNDGYGGKTAFVTFEATAGQVYQIAVDGAGGAFGHITLTGGYKYELNSPDEVAGAAFRVNQSNWVAGGTGLEVLGAGYLLSDELDTMPDTDGSSAYGLNNLGRIAGYNGLPCTWTPAGGFEILQHFPTIDGEALGINDSGTTVGYVGELGGSYGFADRECYWIGTNLFTLEIGDNPLLEDAYAEDINSMDELVGFGTADYNYGHGIYHANYWKLGMADDHVIDLGAIGAESDAYGISEGGEIVGDTLSVDNSVTKTAAWYDGHGHDLRNPGIGSFCYAERNNEKHQIVGAYSWSTTTNSENFHAYLWQNGVYLDLNRIADFGSTNWDFLTRANDINNKGVIVGEGISHGLTQESSFIMTPIEGVHLEHSGFDGDNNFEFDLFGPTNEECVVQATTNLLTPDWETIATCTMPVSGVIQIVDTNTALQNVRFYRAMVGTIRSDNAVGYFIRTLPAAEIFVGYPFWAKDNRIPALFSGAPDDFVVLKWDNPSQSYRTNTYDAVTGWTDPQMTLRPGEGVMAQSPTNFVWRSYGEVIQNCVNLAIATNNMIVSSPIPIAGPVDTALQFPDSKLDKVLKWNPSGIGSFQTFTFGLSGAWSPSTPAMGLGEAFFSRKNRATIWTQNVSIW